MSPKIAIIKLGALGDVIRTTVLLHAYPDADITWVTKMNAIEMLPRERISQIVPFEQAATLKNEMFDLVISLDDEVEAAQLASELQTKVLVGSYINEEGKVVYTDSSAPWFDMGMISRFGLSRADEIKYLNKKTFQAHLLEMVGKAFQGEEYWICKEGADNVGSNRKELVVGVEARAGDRWPTKQWHQYEKLAEELSQRGAAVTFFEQRPTIQEYLKDIAQCDVVVGGDTLGMHLALALQKRVVAIFTCTSPQEIYDYGRMTKIVSPHLKECFYKKHYHAQAVEAISMQQVLDAVIHEMGQVRKSEKGACSGK